MPGPPIAHACAGRDHVDTVRETTAACIIVKSNFGSGRIDSPVRTERCRGVPELHVASIVVGSASLARLTCLACLRAVEREGPRRGRQHCRVRRRGAARVAYPGRHGRSARSLAAHRAPSWRARGTKGRGAAVACDVHDGRPITATTTVVFSCKVAVARAVGVSFSVPQHDLHSGRLERRREPLLRSARAPGFARYATFPYRLVTAGLTAVHVVTTWSSQGDVFRSYTPISAQIFLSRDL